MLARGSYQRYQVVGDLSSHCVLMVERYAHKDHAHCDPHPRCIGAPGNIMSRFIATIEKELDGKSKCYVPLTVRYPK